MLLKYIGIALFATVKFIFSPLLATQTIEGHTWYYTYIAVTSGGFLSASVFYFFAVYFMNRSQERRARKGIVKKKFTKPNKVIIKTKNGIGVLGLCLLTASFISIPLGSIITAKFFRHKKSTIFILYGCIALSAAIFTFITYFSIPT